MGHLAKSTNVRDFQHGKFTPVSDQEVCWLLLEESRNDSIKCLCPLSKKWSARSTNDYSLLLSLSSGHTVRPSNDKTQVDKEPHTSTRHMKLLQ